MMINRQHILTALTCLGLAVFTMALPLSVRAEAVVEPFEPPSESTLQRLNPLKFAAGSKFEDSLASPYATQLSTPGGIISRFLSFAFPIAGLLLFVLLVWGGLQILVGAGGKGGMEAGKKRITAAIIGFIMLFASYWIWQIIEIVFGVVILS